MLGHELNLPTRLALVLLGASVVFVLAYCSCGVEVAVCA